MRDEIWTGATTALLRQTIYDGGTRAQLASEALRGILTPAAIAATQNNYAPAGVNQARVLRLVATGPQIITGFDIAQWPAAERDGLVLDVYNVSAGGANIITLPYLDAGSLAANQWRWNNGAAFVLEAEGHCRWWYDPSSVCWRISA